MLGVWSYQYGITEEKYFRTSGKQVNNIDFDKIKDIEELDLSYNNISEIIPEISKLTKLKILKLHSCHLKSIPKELFLLKELRCLDLGWNEISKLPPGIEELKHLEILDLEHNNLSQFPIGICQLLNLQHLELGSNKIPSISPRINNLTCLKTLRIDNNVLSTVPYEIGGLKNVWSFNFEGNQLDSLPNCFFDLPLLKELKLDDNQLTKLPDSVFQLTALEHLELKNNRLQEIPSSIALLQSLKFLYIEGNNIQRLPIEITQISHLIKPVIKLSKSQPESLPFTNLLKTWDVFISHASEEKDDIAKPLAKMLENAGLRVWIDKSEIAIGDSIRSKIDEGLFNSVFGIIILSQNFFQKEWTKNEFDALLALEVNGQHKILPVWHGVTKEEVFRFSPILAGRLAANTSDGLEQLSAMLIDTILYRAHWLLNEKFIDAPQLFLRLLLRKPALSKIRDFLISNREIVERRILGEVVRDLRGDFQLNDNEIIAREDHNSWTLHIFCFVCFFQPSAKIFNPDGGLQPEIKAQISRVKKITKGKVPVEEKQGTEGRYNHLYEWAQKGHRGTNFIIVGRRSSLTPEDVDSLRILNEDLRNQGFEIRTYDWLVESSFEYLKYGRKR
ncbi:TIR domain-containing protein [Mucilaginibacter sp. AW1-3]